MKHINFVRKMTFPVLICLAVGCTTTKSPDPIDSSDRSDTLYSAEPTADLETMAMYTPSRIGNTEVFNSITVKELRQLNLVATNLVSVLLQIPELRPMSVKLQVAEPITPFGNVLVRVLEDAGFALQLVSADQGTHYVSYGRRFAETDTGPVTDFNLSINDINLSREFVVKPNGIFPASLMNIRGTAYIDDIEVTDEIFKEQGSDVETDSFISGAMSEDAGSAAVSEVRVNSYDRIPVNKQTPRLMVMAKARQHYFKSDRQIPQLAKFDRYRRTVFVFTDKDTLYLGPSNKRSAGLMAREFDENDLLIVKACNDVDGTNEVAVLRAIRVEEEFISNGVPQTSIYLAPCSRTNYRHSADNSPVPVEVVHYRLKES